MSRYWLVCILLTCASAHSQQRTDDPAQVRELLTLSLKNQWINPDLSLTQANEALEKARRVNDKASIAAAQNLKGFAYWTFGDNELAIQSALEASTIATAEKLIQIQAESYYILARGYMDLGEA